MGMVRRRTGWYGEQPPMCESQDIQNIGEQREGVS